MIRKSEFKPAWWLPGPHLQTLWPSVFRRFPKLIIKRERFELSDGDFIDLDWLDNNNEGPIVLVLHGLAGSIESPYAKGILQCINQSGWRGVLMHFRGCSGEPNRLPRLYHSGETNDVGEVVAVLRSRYPNTAIAAVGYSLGGSVLLKWLGETQENNPLIAAVAVSVPFELHIAAKQVNEGFARFYQWAMLRDLRRLVAKKFKAIKPPTDFGDLSVLRNFHEFDSKITAPLHGFKDAIDYYTRCSSRQFLKSIQKPTLILHADDDPLVNKNLHFKEGELSQHVVFESSKYGGHVGFVTGNSPLCPEYWLEQRIPQYLTPYLNTYSVPILDMMQQTA